MDEPVKRLVAALAGLRLVAYLNCSQATLNTLRRYLKATDRDVLLFASPLEGGGAGSGSTCGVVSGGCLAIALGHLGDVLEPEQGKAESLYRRLKDYTVWFRDGFGTTLCRERTGLDLGRATGLVRYLLEGRFLSRCTRAAVAAVPRLVGMVEEPLAGSGRAGELDERLFREGGLCGSGVLAEARRRFGLGSVTLERLSLALDGGVGLSGGLCGALAAALGCLGLVLGNDPERGVLRNLAFFTRGHYYLYLGKEADEQWSRGSRLVEAFREEFGSLECAALTGREFSSGSELMEYLGISATCDKIRRWCADKAVEVLEVLGERGNPRAGG
jgi:hypothetical protein